MTPRQHLVYEVVGLLRKGQPLKDKDHCVRAVEEIMSENTILGNRFDGLNCEFSRFAASVWSIYNGL